MVLSHCYFARLGTNVLFQHYRRSSTLKKKKGITHFENTQTYPHRTTNYPYSLWHGTANGTKYSEQGWIYVFF